MLDATTTFFAWDRTEYISEVHATKSKARLYKKPAIFSRCGMRVIDLEIQKEELLICGQL